MKEFLSKLARLPIGYSTGHHKSLRYVTTISKSQDGQRIKLYAEEAGGNDHISFNLYFLSSGEPLLKPCEMTEQKVIDFVLGYDVED